MRVLMFGWEFPPHISGGLGTACFGMTQALAKKNTEVIFVVPCTKENTGPDHLKLIPASGTKISYRVQQRINSNISELLGNKFTFYTIKSLLFAYASPQSYTDQFDNYSSVEKQFNITKDNSYSQVTGPQLLNGGYGSNLMDEVYRYSQIAAEIASNEHFDVIHVHDWMTYLAGIVARQVSGKPLVAHIHATEYDRSGIHVNQAVADIERLGLNSADMVIAVSHLTKKTIMKNYDVPSEKIKVVHNAVKRQDIQHRYKVPVRLMREKRVLFLGRVTYQKGPDYFIEAANLVLEREKNVRFFMAGNGDMLPHIIRRASQLKIGNRFHFCGFLKGTQVDQIFALSDLYVMPSVSEPFGITPLEAMLYDVPVLLSKQSGVSEVLTHALKADFWDTRDIADKICAVLRYPDLVSELVKNCRGELKSIRWENAAEQINQVYESVCA